jgi:hypothetical protein
MLVTPKTSEPLIKLGTVMSMKNRILIISCVVVIFIAFILIFSPILRSQPIAIKVGETYQDIITVDDPSAGSDKDYRRHTYSLNVLSKEKYTININSLSGDAILLFENHDGNITQLMEISTGGMGATEYEVHSAGKKIFYIEALASDCPAEYQLKVYKQ